MSIKLLPKSIQNSILKLIQVYGDFVRTQTFLHRDAEIKFKVYFSPKPLGDHLFTFDIPFIKTYLIIEVSSSHGILVVKHIDL